MTVKNSWFVPAEISFSGWIVSHTVINEWLQTILIVVTIIATLVGLWKTVKGKK